MADYPLDMQLVVDPLNPENVVRGGSIYFYDPADVAGTNPIAIKDPSGLPLPNPLTSNDYGFIQPTIVTIPKVKWKSGNFEGFFFSYDGLRNEAVAAKTAAESAASTAGAAAVTDIAARVAAGQFKGAPGADGSNVLPTDTAIKDAINTAGSATRGALNATYLTVSEAPLTPERYGALGNGSANDTAAINAMLTALVPGGEIQFLPNRRYMTSGGHQITKPSVKITGSSGRAQTYNSSAQLYLRNAANTDMFTISANQVTMRDLSLYGNYNNQTGVSRGIVTPAALGANYLLLDSVWVDSFRGSGFVFESPATLSSTIVNCESRKNQGYGMHFTGTATDSMVANCYIDQNAQSGVYCTAGDMSLTSVHIWGNGTATTGDRDGITFQSSAGCRVVNCYIETQHEGAGIRFKSGNNSGHIIMGNDIWENGFQGIYGFAAANGVISGNIIRSNNYKGSATTSGAGITFDSCTGMSTTGNNFFSTGLNRQTYGYYEVGTANAGNIFMGNVSRASQHTTGNWVIATGTASPTLPATPAAFNAG